MVQSRPAETHQKSVDLDDGRYTSRYDMILELIVIAQVHDEDVCLCSMFRL